MILELIKIKIRKTFRRFPSFSISFLSQVSFYRFLFSPPTAKRFSGSMLLWTSLMNMLEFPPSAISRLLSFEELEIRWRPSGSRIWWMQNDSYDSFFCCCCCPKWLVTHCSHGSPKFVLLNSPYIICLDMYFIQFLISLFSLNARLLEYVTRIVISLILYPYLSNVPPYCLHRWLSWDTATFVFLTSHLMSLN